ncbi:MAG: hypothetical protein IPI73_16115 [Betaproteobacteria bacterium]|nr:hypothetical protein [Betaproteobacteria bacterium]
MTAEGLAAVAEVRRASDFRLLVLHGLLRPAMVAAGHDHGAVARDPGYAPLYLHYNSGRHISTNGREFAALMETLVQAWPAPIAELVIVGHSMGGLIARSAPACRARFRERLAATGEKAQSSSARLIAAPLSEWRALGRHLPGRQPYTAPFSRLGKIRSAGVTDLRYGELPDEDWVGRDRFARSRDHRCRCRCPRRRLRCARRD